MMEFFNAGDIEVLNRVGHKSFRGDDAQNEYDAQLIKNGPLAKTDYWADELAKRLPDFMFTKGLHFSEDFGRRDFYNGVREGFFWKIRKRG